MREYRVCVVASSGKYWFTVMAIDNFEAIYTVANRIKASQTDRKNFPDYFFDFLDPIHGIQVIT